MGKKLTADKIKALEENANILMQQGASQGDIDLMTSQFIEEFGVDDAMPEKKNEVQGLNVEVGTSVGSSVKSPVSSIKTEQNVGLSPSGKKGIDILRGASVKPISPTKTAIPQTPKKKKSKVEELRKSIQQKVAVGEPLTTDEVSEVRDISSNAFLPLDGLKDGEVNAVLAGAQNKQNQQLISKSRNDQYQKQLKDRIVSGEVLPEDIKGMYDVSGFAPPDTDFEKLANDWNAENIKIKQKIDSELLNESTKVDKYIVDLDDKIRNLERQAVETRRTTKNEMDIEAQSATDGAIRNLKSIKYKAQEYLDYLSEKAIDTSKDEIIKRVNKIQGVRDEKGLVKDVVSLEQVVDDYISTQPTEKQNLLLRKKPYLVESLVASEYVIPKANEVFYQKAESIISDVPQSAKQLFKRVTGEIDVKDGEEKYYDTQQQFAIANNAASLYFMDEVARTNQAFESVVSLPNVRNAVGGKLDVLKQQYDAGQISASDYKLKRLQALSLNPQTSEYVKEYVRKIQNAQERYESKIDKFLQSKVPDFAKFTEVDESGNIVSIAGMKPMEFTQKMTELQTAKTESLNEAASMYKTDIENRAVERRGELFGGGIKSWVGASFANGTYGLFESMGRWAYDNTGLEFFDASRRGATDMLYNSSVPFESQEVQDIMDIEAGDYAKAFNPLYITRVASESAPYMLATMAAGIATGGLAEGVLLGMGLSEGIGAAITLSRAGRVAQKTIAAISSGTSDAYLNMTANYNDLIKEGYSKEQAKQIAFDAFKNELPVDILSGAVEINALFRATSKPTIKNIIKGGANKAGSILIEEPIQEVYQGYSLEKAKGTSKSLVDYAFFDKEGFNNLVGGFAGGLGTSAVTNAMGIAKNALSWNRLYNVSTADMQNAVRYAGVAQMVATPSEMQNSINLDLLKSAQSISQEEYQKIPNNERAQKEKAKNEYVNRTVAYVYGKSINNSVQNGLNIEDVHEHYKAHNEAISKAYSTLAELANETNKPMYKKQADYYASLAQKSEIGQQTPIYSLITPKGRVFISEQTAKTLGEGSIQQKNDSFAKAVRAGDIIGVQVVDDSQTAQSLIKKFDDAKLSQQLAVQQSQGGATEVGQPNQTNVQTPIEGTTEIPTTKGVIDEPNISPESTTSTAQEQVEVSGLGTETIGGEVAAQPEQQPISTTQSGSNPTTLKNGDKYTDAKGVERIWGENTEADKTHEIEQMLKATAEGAAMGATIQSVEDFKSGKETIFRKPQSIEAAKNNPNYNVEIQSDGSAKVIGVLDPRNNEWVGVGIEKSIENKNVTTIDNFNEIFDKGYGRLEISSNGEKVDFNKFDIVIDKEDNTAEIAYIEKKNRDKNKGIGVESYIELAKELDKKGISLISSGGNAKLKGGNAIWDSLNKLGLVEKYGNGGYKLNLDKLKNNQKNTTPTADEVQSIQSQIDELVAKRKAEYDNALVGKENLSQTVKDNLNKKISANYNPQIDVLQKRLDEIAKNNVESKEQTPTALRDVESTAKALEEGNKIQWNVFGNEESGEWTVGEKTKTRGGKDAVVLRKVYVEASSDGKSYTKEYADANGIKYDNERTVEHIVPLEDLKSESLSKEQAPPALRDVESTAKALETESKNKPTIWEQVKNAAKNIIEGIKNIGKSEYEKRRKLVDDIEFNDYPSDKEGEIILKKDGKNIGSMDLHYGADGLLHIKWVKINKDFQGKGLSLLLYGKATEIAAQKGLKGVGTGFVTHSTTKTQGIYKHFNLTELGESKGSMEEGVKGRKVILHSLKDGNENNSISEAYHAAKKDSSNPELVKAVESLLSKEQQPIEIDESTPFDLSIALQTKKEEQDAIQKQSTTEEVLLNERPEMGLQEVGEGNAQVEAVAEQGNQKEKIEVAPLSFTPKNFIEELIGVEGAVALSGINEQQRQELIKDRLRTTTLTPQKEKEREIVKLVKSHNGMRRNARERLDVRGRIMRLVNDYNKEYPNQKLTFKSWYGDVKVTRPSFDRKQKSTYQKDLTVANLDVSNASLDETEKTFSERSDEFQRKFIELMDLGVQFEFRDAGNKKFSQKMLDDAMNDLDNGIPSRRAAVILNTVEKAIEENVITVGGSLTEGFQYIPLNLAIEETKEMKYEDELRNLSNAEIVAIYENEILAQKELDNIIQQEYEKEFESDPNDEFGNVRQLAPRKKRDIINPNQEGDNQGQTSEGTIEENQNVENETPKTTANREAGENLVGGNQADIPTNADGNGQREEEITENTPKQGEEGVGVVTGAPTPVISEMDRAVLDAMKPTFEIEFIPNAKFLNTSAPLENKSSQDAVKRRYQTIKKLLECL
jgi:ribosomal protein S18 acetylase RimI-like enzyme